MSYRVVLVNKFRFMGCLRVVLVKENEMGRGKLRSLTYV